jgi:hypothetical protein
MWLHDQRARRFVKPAATVTISNVNKIHWPVVLGRPALVLDLPHLCINQHQASRSQQRHHSPIRKPDITVAVPRVLLDQRAFKMAPPLHHPRKKIGAPRIECRIESQWHPQSTWWRRHVGSWNLEIYPILKALFDWNIEPPKQIQGIQVVEHGQSVQLVQTGHDVAIFDVCQPTDMKNEVRAATTQREFITRRLDISVGKSKTLADLAQSQSGQHETPLVGDFSDPQYILITTLLRIQNRIMKTIELAGHRANATGTCVCGSRLALLVHSLESAILKK